MDTTTLHLELLRSCEPGAISIDLQQRVLDHALRHRDRSVLLALLGRPDLDDDVDRALGTTRDISVLVPWLLRDGRHPGQIIERAATEPRVTVLAAIAATRGLPEDVYLHLAAKDSERVLRAIIENSSAGPDAVCTAATTLAARRPRTLGTQKTIDDIANLVNQSRYRRAIWETIGLHGTALPHAIAVLENIRPSAEIVERWATEIESMYRHDGKRWRKATWRFVGEITACPLTRKQHAALLAGVNRILADGDETGEPWVGELRAERANLVTYDIEAEELVRTLRDEHRSAEAVALLEDLRDRCKGYQFQRLAATALAHPTLPVDSLYPLRHSLGVPEIGNLVRRIITAQREDLLFAWLDEYRHSAHPPALLSFAVGGADTLRSYLEHVSERGDFWPAWSIETALVADRPDLALGHLAWTTLATTASAQPSLVNHLARRIGEEFSGRERWEAFEALGPAFEGTFDDLVRVIDALS
jgi:hypothetical protein